MARQIDRLALDKESLGAKCVMFHLRRSTRVVSKLYSGILADIGLESTHFSALMIISRLGPLSISDIAKKMGLERTSMSRNLKPIARKHLIDISDSGHGRARQVEITKKGREALAEAIPQWEAAQANLRSLIGDEDTDTLITLLIRIYAMTAMDTE